MRKQFVYRLRDQYYDMHKQLRESPLKDEPFSLLKSKIAFNEIRTALADPSGGLTASYELERLNDSMKDDK